MATATILETPRLLLREYVEDDAAAVYQLGSDPLVNRFSSDERLTSVEEARAILRAHPLADYRKYGYGRWACILKETGVNIGFAGLKYLDDRKEVDVGYRLLPAYWGAGLATEAALASIRYGFERLQLRRIIGLVVPENVASVRVLEKCGLTCEGMTDFRGKRLALYAVAVENFRV
jgi:RimJ/RimL family protein N-acetyltransferase